MAIERLKNVLAPDKGLVSADGRPPESLYWPQLDGLRALAFLLVFMEHQSPIPITPQMAAIPGLPPVIALIYQAMRWGWLGVDLFFVLSAFLITTLLLQERERFGTLSFSRFFIRRALRIWPLYFATLVLGFAVLPALQYYEFPWGSPEWKSMISSYLPAYLIFLGNLKQAVVQPAPLSFLLAISWSVAMEEQFYVVWGLILKCCLRPAVLGWLITLGFPATLGLRWLIYLQTHHQRAFYFNTFTHLDPILIGAGLALLIQSGKLGPAQLKRWGPALMATPLALFGLLVLLAPPLEQSHGSMVFILSLIALGAGMFLLALLYWEPAKRLFSHPLLVWLGQLSFGLYLLHPLGKDLGRLLTMSVFEANLSAHLLFAWGFYLMSSLLATILLAWLSWHLLEKHCNRLRKHFMRVPSGTP